MPAVPPPRGGAGRRRLGRRCRLAAGAGVPRRCRCWRCRSRQPRATGAGQVTRASRFHRAQHARVCRIQDRACAAARHADWSGAACRCARRRRAPCYLDAVSSTFGVLFRITTFGESHGPAVGVVIDGCPPRLPLSAGGDPGRARPPPAGAEPHHHAAARGRPGRDPLRRPRRADPGHADRAAGAQQRPARRRLRGDADQVPPLPRRLHLPGQVRHPRLGGRRPGQRARDHRPGGGRGGRAQAAGARGRASRSSPGSSRVAELEAAVDPAAGHRATRSRPTSSAARTRPWPSR